MTSLAVEIEVVDDNRKKDLRCLYAFFTFIGVDSTSTSTSVTVEAIDTVESIRKSAIRFPVTSMSVWFTGEEDGGVGMVTPRRAIGRVFVGVLSTSMSSGVRRSKGSAVLAESAEWEGAVEGEGEGEGNTADGLRNRAGPEGQLVPMP